MNDLLNGLEYLKNLEAFLPYVKWGAIGIGVMLAVITLAAFTYIIKSTVQPAWVVGRWGVGYPVCIGVKWMVGYLPKEPGEIASGVNHGARMLVWTTLVALIAWAFLH